MRNLFKKLLFSSFVIAGVSGVASAQAFKVDAEKSSLAWSGTKVIGGAHDGTIKLAGGVLNWKDGNLTSANIDVDMKTIVNNDISSAEFKKKLVDHLVSDDFFSVAKHPTATFKLTKSQLVKDGNYRLSGTMTIKGISKDVDFMAKLQPDGSMLKGKGEITLDRTDFNVKYGSGKFFDNLGDKMIADEIKLKFDLVASK